MKDFSLSDILRIVLETLLPAYLDLICLDFYFTIGWIFTALFWGDFWELWLHPKAVSEQEGRLKITILESISVWSAELKNRILIYN